MKRLLLASSLFFVLSQLYAQASFCLTQSMVESQLLEWAAQEMLPATDEPGTIRRVTRTHRKLPASYSGFAIELTVTDRPLGRSNHLFKKFGDIRYTKQADGRYAYLIPISFRRRASVENYLHNIIIYKAPGARVREFKLGVDTELAAQRRPRYRFD